MTIPEFLPRDFYEFFINPILKIDVEDDDRGKKFKIFAEGITGTQLDKYFNILLAYSDFLLNLEKKKQLLEFIYERCPPKNHFYVTYFKRFLAAICWEFISKNEKHEKLIQINDILLEYWASHFEFYSIKLYQRKGSLSRLIENTKYLLESLIGYENGYRATIGGLGAEHHKNTEMRATFNEEVVMVLYFNQNKKKFFDHNNIYILFWTGTGKLKLWDDISMATINNIAEFFEEYLINPEIELVNINQSSYFKKSNLPKIIVDAIEDISKKKSPLKFNRIIDSDIKFEERTYQDVIVEINGTYRHYYFASMYILVRKLLENLLIDCLRNYYKPQNSSKYFSTGKGRFHSFEVLKDNFNLMIKEADFIKNSGTVHQTLIDLLGLFKDIGNSSAHSLFSISHQSIIEDNKNEINDLIKKLQEIRSVDHV